MPQLMPSNNSGQGNDFDIMGFLKQIAQGDPNNPMQNWHGTNPQPSPSQQIMQDVATKAYTKNLQTDAESTPPQILAHLIDQWGQQGGGEVPGVNQGMTGQPNAAPAEQSAAPAEPPSIDQQIEQINKQAALNVAKRNLQASQPPNFMQRFGQNLAKMEGGITQADQLANMQTIQKIAGAEPLQPKDISEMTAGTYKAGLEATHQALAVEGQKFTALGELYNKLNETKGRINQTLGTASDEQKEVYKSLKITAKNINTHVGNLGELINNRPKFSSKGVSSQTQNKGNMVGKYTIVNQ